MAKWGKKLLSVSQQLENQAGLVYYLKSKEDA